METYEQRIRLIHLLFSILNGKGYLIYRKPFQLNIIGVRTLGKVNYFDDWIYVIYHNGSEWLLESFRATTKPGFYYLRNLLNPKGTAILRAGQYLNTYKIDLHRGKYRALCQRLKPVIVYRDKNKDDNLDLIAGAIEAGMFGINIHRANPSFAVNLVDRYSAACQVIKDPNDFKRLMELADEHSKRYGNVFSYTLINHNDNYTVDEKTLIKEIENSALPRGLGEVK